MGCFAKFSGCMMGKRRKRLAVGIFLAPIQLCAEMAEMSLQGF